MKKIALAVFFFLAMISLAPAQKNVLVLEKQGNKKNFKYYEGDKIEFRTTDSLMMKGMISSIKDTTITLDFYSEISVKKIAEVQRQRWAINILSKVMMIGGIGLVALEAVNGAISTSGDINPNTLYLGAGIAGAGALLIPLQKSHLYVGPEQWKIKILPAESQFNYQKNKPIQF